MRPALAWVVVAALALPGCAALESVFKPAAPSASPPAPAPVPPAQARPAPPPLQPQLSEREERRLRDQATRLIGEAERATQGVRTDGLQPAQRETFGSIQSFLQQARQALTDRDYERASTLARKAETLAQDLPQAQR